jgi:hypothetical protein
VPSGAMSSRQGVLPPYRQVAGSTVGVEPRTPQKLSLVTGLPADLFSEPLIEVPEIAPAADCLFVYLLKVPTPRYKTRSSARLF